MIIFIVKARGVRVRGEKKISWSWNGYSWRSESLPAIKGPCSFSLSLLAVSMIFPVTAFSTHSQSWLRLPFYSIQKTCNMPR